ncbi:SDR family NAD(P)-dependent oxidoreductase [Streptomyces sp. NPDC087420]|uniref:SDR family NAD(P)-dependent oxidoreductase n=1 Tax=Streptomyces sp. NPDC087420 TaxID=3365785 RepID=UPI00383964ED
MDMELSGRTAVVTGAGRGIGLAVTRALAAEGAQVVAGSRSVTDELAKLAGSHAVHPVAVDLAAPSGPADLIARAVELTGGVDILVNNIGGLRPRTEGFLSITDDDWDHALLVNLMSAVRTIRAVLPHLLDRGAGNIVTISSVNAMLPDPLVVDYGAAKAALTNVCKAVSKEYGPRGIRCNTISPGPVSTALWLGDGGVAATVARASGQDPAAVADHAAGDSVTGRFTRPEEVADLVVWLAGGRASNITGADFTIDGGLITTV